MSDMSWIDAMTGGRSPHGDVRAPGHPFLPQQQAQPNSGGQGFPGAAPAGQAEPDVDFDDILKPDPQGQPRQPGEPEQDAPKPATEEFVPIGAHKKRIARMATRYGALEAEHAKLKEQMAALEGKSQEREPLELARTIAKAQKPEGWDKLGEEERIAWIAAQVAQKSAPRQAEREDPRLAKLERRLDDLSTFQGLAPEQMAVIEDLRSQHPTIREPQKLLALAQLEEPALFRETAARVGTGFMGPGAGGGPQPERRVTSHEIAKKMATLHPNDPRRAELGPLMVRLQMEERPEADRR